MIRENIFFIADQHLDPKASPGLTKLFFSFLDHVRQDQGELFILGDLFDYWANNRLIFEKNRCILQALQELVRQGCPVSIIRGNRDFLLKSAYLSKFGIRLLGNEHYLQAGEHKVLLTHGDILFNRDKKYKLYRRIGWKVLYLGDICTPGWLEHKVAMVLRRQSRTKESGQDAQLAIPDESKLKRYFNAGYDTIICGHVHKPQIVNYPQGKRLIVLPAWEENQPESGRYGLFQKGAFTFHEFKL